MWNIVRALEQTDEEMRIAVDELDSRVMELESLNRTSDDVADELSDLDTRLSELELNGTVAFHASISATVPNIPEGTSVVFDEINLNIGNGYDNITGNFVVPIGGAGLYFFYAHFLFYVGGNYHISVRRNETALCMDYEDNRFSGDFGGSSCGIVVALFEG